MTRIAAGLMLWVLVVGAHAAAQELEEVPEPDWIPSIDVGFEVFAWESNDSVQNLVNGPLWSASETNSITQLLVTIGGSLAGPALESVPGRPRLFVGGGLGIPTDTADQTIAIGDPASSVNPEQDISNYIGRLETSIRRNCLTIPTRECPEPEVERFDTVHELDDGLHLLAEIVIGHTEHGNVGDRRVIDEQVLKLLRVDVHAAGDDH
jgi:hypothetical protein